MEALVAAYADDSSDSDSDSNPTPPPPQPQTSITQNTTVVPLPPPPISLLEPPNSLVSLDSLQSSSSQPDRIRSFPHVEGNYALHVYIPVHIPSETKKELACFLKKVTTLVPRLRGVDIDIPLSTLLEDEARFGQVVLGREFHISLGRTVPVRVHQINSIIFMLRQKLQSQRRYWIDFNKWEIFVNDDKTRTFMSLEVIGGGLGQVRKQIEVVNGVYKLHNLPEFYKDPRPHISLAWALGDISDVLKGTVENEMKKYARKCIFTSKFSGILCKVGNKTHEIC